jgi:hypothetical protein
MDHLIESILKLQPIDMSIVMVVAVILDLWTALTLSIKSRSTVSKTLIKGFSVNLLIIFLPYLLRLTTLSIPGAGKSDFDYVQMVSVGITVLFIVTTATSIIANYSACFPESKNFLTKFAYKWLPAEIEKKQEKHGITKSDDVTENVLEDVVREVLNAQKEVSESPVVDTPKEVIDTPKEVINTPQEVTKQPKGGA